MSEWLQDVRYSARLLLKSPGYTVACVLSLALGIGVNTAVLAVGKSLLLAPLPVPEPGRLAIAYWWRGDSIKGVREFATGGLKDERSGRNLHSNFDYPMYRTLQGEVRDRANVFAFSFLKQVNVSLDAQPVAGGAMLVSGNYFEALRVPMHLGRGIQDRDDRPDAEPVAVIGFGMWRRTFGGDPSVIGKVLRVNGIACTLVGVTGRGYFGVSNGGYFSPADVSVPLSAQPLVQPQWTAPDGTLFTSERTQWLHVMARLEPGVDRGSLQSALSTVFVDRLRTSPFPVAAGAQPPAITLTDGAQGFNSMRETMEQPLTLLAGAAALVFLIACVNIAGLALVRGVARRREVWIRLALGAGRGRVVRQATVESLLLALAGGVFGTLVAASLGPALVSALAGSTPTAITVRLDATLIALAAGVSAIAALLFGVVPALRLASGHNADLLRHGGAGSSAPRLRTGRTLVLVQVAIAVPLVIGAALFLRTIHNLAGVDLGFESRGLVVFKMDPTLNGYDAARTRDLFRRVTDRVAAIGGVRQVTLVENVLISHWMSQSNFSVDGEKPRSVLVNRVGPAFFETLGLPIVAGRGVDVQDSADAPPVAVINEAGVRTLFKGVNPVGRTIVLSGRKPVTLHVVGVARDARYTTLKASPVATIYLPYFQNAGTGAVHVVVRADGEQHVVGALAGAIAEVDPDVPISGAKTQTRQIEDTIGPERALTTLLVSFGLFALFLACMGLHGVTAYTVARRTSELGIRLALGAPRAGVVWLILRQVVAVAAAGLALGIPLAFLGARAVRSFLFGVQPADPWSVGIGIAVLVSVTVAAGVVPALRAARLNPLVALRSD